MDIDIILEADVSAAQVAELAKIAEGYGIRGLWTSNYPDSRDAFMALSLATQNTQRIKLGALAVSPFELHPLKMANALLTLNEMSEGRATITVGGGGAVMGAMGQTWSRMVQTVKENVQILKQAASGKFLKYEGEVFQIHNYCARWASHTPPQIYIGANKKNMIHMSAKEADGIMVGDMTPTLLSHALDLVEEGLSMAGKSRRDFRVSNFWAWHIKEDRASADWEARQQLALRGVLEPYYFSPFMSEEECALIRQNKPAFFKAYRMNTDKIEGVPDEIIEKMISNITSTGTRDDLDRHLERFKEFRDLGLDELAIRVHQDPAYAIKLIGEEVMPALA